MISQEYLDKLAQVESSNNPLARNPKSSAKGRFQFVDTTAAQYGLDKHIFGTPEYEKAETEAVKTFTADNYNALKKALGRSPTNGELYLAHQQGASGASKLLSDPDANAVQVLGRDQVINNGGDEEMTAAEFSNQWTSKFSEIDEAQKEVAPLNLYELLGKEPKKTTEGKDLNLYSLLGVDVPADEVNEPEDLKTGAQPYIRAIVGSIKKPEDRLGTLQKYYPDAEPYGDNNFIFTHPETGLKTLYNPKGLDKGDIASGTRELMIAAGSTVGAGIAGGGALVAGQLGPQIATPEEIITVPLATTAGAGLGGSIAASAFDNLAVAFGIKQDTRTPEEMAREAAGEVALGVTGELGGAAIGALVRPLQKPISQGAEMTKNSIVEAFDAMGVTPTLATVSKDNAMASRLQAGLAQNLVSAETIEKISQKQIEQTNKAINKVIAKIGPAKTTQGAGEVVQEAARLASERFRGIQTELYDDVFDTIGPATRANVKNVAELKEEIAASIADAPQSLGPAYKKTLKELDAIIADAGEEGLSFGALREIRTMIGRRMNKPNLIDSGGTSQEQLKRIYGALTLDISEAAARAGPEAAHKLKKADRATRMFMKTSADTIDKINRFDAEERAFKYVLSGAKDGASRLERLKRNFKPEEWDTISASIIRKLGNPNADGNYMLSTFLRNYKQLAPETRQALLGGNRYKGAREALDDLVIVLDQLKDVERYANTSNTAGAIHAMNLVNTLGGGVGGGLGALMGDPVTGAGAGYIMTKVGSEGAPLLGAKIVSSESIARLVSNPAFVRWLAEPMKAATWGAAESAKHIGKLAVIAKGNADIRDEIYEFSDILEQDTRENK